MKLHRSTLLCFAALLLSACNNSGTPASSAQQTSGTKAGPPYQPTATFQDVMDAAVDAPADYIWNSVSTISDEKGIHEYQPRTDEEWHEFRRRAVMLVEAANLLSIPGRRVANGDKTLEAQEALPVAEIQQRLDSNHEALVGFAGALREVSLKLVAAADRRDVAAVTDLGGALDQVCESCHMVFWYPEATAAAK